MRTGDLLWRKEFPGSVEAPPVGFLRQIYVPMNDRLIVLDSDGPLRHEAPLPGRSRAAALSVDHVFVPTREGIQTFLLDPQQGSAFDGTIEYAAPSWWTRSGLAIAQDGTVYVSTPDGFVHAYGTAP